MKPFFQSRNSKNPQSGNILLLVLAAVILLALMTALVSQQSETQTDVLSRQTMDDEISRMLAQTSALGGALSQMVVNGEAPETLYQTVSMLKPGDAGYETAPHNLKLFHPYGGGLDYMSTSSNSATPMATGINIVPGAIVTGIGETNAVVGDIVFTARIDSATHCQRINTIVTGAAAGTTPPVMTTVDFDALFTAGTTVTVGADCTPTCANIPRQCVSNTAGTAWGFYSALFPG